MPATRSTKQQKLTIAEDKGEVQVEQGEKRERGEDGPAEKGDDKKSDSQERPAKAAKVEQQEGDGKDDDVKAEQNGNDDKNKDGGDGKDKEAPKDSKTDSTNKDIQPASTTEETLSGKDSSSNTQWTILERGHVYFFYRPKVQSAEDSNKQAADSLSSVQNFHLLLLPRASDSSTAPATSSSSSNERTQDGSKANASGISARLLRLGKKRMPEPEVALSNGEQPGGLGGDSSEAIWAVISDVGTTFEELKDSFSKREYSTKTSGQRVVQGSRVVGRGWYAISESLVDPPSAREVRLSYVLSHPSEMGDVQSELGLAEQSSVQLQMRNPTLPQTGQGAPVAGLDDADRVELTREELESTFGGDSESGTRYARPEKLNLLDRAGVELLLIKRKGEDGVGLGETQQKAMEKLARDEGKKMDSGDVIQKELHLDAKDNPPDALEGDWI